MALSSFYRPPPKAPAEPLALRPIQAAETLGVSLSTLERLTRAGEIESVSIGRCRVYEVEVLKAYLQNRRESAKEGQP
jgi:excisionase family DNA binding protein